MKKGSGKRVSRKNSSKGKVTRVIHESTKEIKIDRALVENFIALQKVMVNLSARFDHLSGEIAKLLELFEISAKALARKDFEETGKSSKDTEKILEKLNNLSQQAGLIGKGLALIHETRTESNEQFQSRPIQMTVPSASVRPLQQANRQMQTAQPASQMNRQPSVPTFAPPMPSSSNHEFQKSIQLKPSETGA